MPVILTYAGPGAPSVFNCVSFNLTCFQVWVSVNGLLKRVEAILWYQVILLTVPLYDGREMWDLKGIIDLDSHPIRRPCHKLFLVDEIMFRLTNLGGISNS